MHDNACVTISMSKDLSFGLIVHMRSYVVCARQCGCTDSSENSLLASLISCTGK